MTVVVPRTPTPLSEESASALLVSKLRAKLGRDPSQELASGVFALMWTETARGTAIIDHNMGNITAYAGFPQIWRPEWYDLAEVNALPDGPHKDRLLSLHARMVASPPTAPSAFRAYDSADAGMTDYVERLFKDFPEVVQAAETGSASNLVAAVRQKYSKDYDPSHVRTFELFQKEFGERQLFAALPKGGAESGSPSQLPLPGLSLFGGVDVPKLRKGSTSFYVVLWKNLLNDLIGTSLRLSPDFDDATDEATRGFQSSHEIKSDGVVGPVTWSKALGV